MVINRLLMMEEGFLMTGTQEASDLGSNCRTHQKPTVARKRRRIPSRRRIEMLIRKISVLITAVMMAFSALFYSAAYSAPLPLTTLEEEDLLFMREEEKLARDTYLTFYEKWDLAVFSNIASSEQMHMNALLKLLKKYDLADPAAGNDIGEFTNTTLQSLYTTLIGMGMVGPLQALKVGGLIEEKDMVDIKESIERSDHADIDAVYESLLCGSRNHLRAFAQNIKALYGEEYTLQYPDSDYAEIYAILTSPMEKCGKKPSPARNETECKGKCLGWMK
jgi:hypothetical protein